MLKALAASVLFVSPVTCDDGFNDWVLKYKKSYENEDLKKRAYETWTQNAQIVRNINSNSSSTWKAGLNYFADLTAEEFAKKILVRGARSSDFRVTADKPIRKNTVLESQPASYDWREHGNIIFMCKVYLFRLFLLIGAVTPVHDQGNVGTCWAFSAIGNIEGQWFLKQKSLINLSEEFLVDCDGTHDEYHADCSVFGGWPYLAYQYVINAGGVPSEATWPYCSGTGDCYPCMQGPVSLCGPPPYYCDKAIEEYCPSAQRSAFISSWTAVSEDETVIADSLVAVGPLSALLDATQLQYYESGVWNGHVSGSPVWAGCKEVSVLEFDENISFDVNSFVYYC